MRWLLGLGLLLSGITVLCWSFPIESDPAIVRGAEAYKNWCAGCHALQYVRAPFAVMQQVSMPAEEAVQWFGKMPPDLSLIATIRGKQWLTGYLLGFYPDASRPYGSNNRLIPGVMMPDPFTTLPAPPHALVADLVAFLDYVAVPNRLESRHIGRIVVLFLFIFWLVMMALQRLLWKKIVRHF